MSLRYIDASRVTCWFSADEQPITVVPLNTPVWIETLDCYGDQIQDEHSGISISIPGVNPVTGPLFIEGVTSGDTLAVDIIAIEPREYGIMYLRPEAGLYKKVLTHAEIRKIPLKNGQYCLPGGLYIDFEPMIGSIGTAPAAASIPSTIPGRHGGNMDTRQITCGSTLYLPVFVEGALFAVGDIHGAMGDGETGICGLETAARVQLRFRVIENYQEPWPIVENNDYWITIASGDTLDQASHEAAYAMFNFIASRTNLTSHDIVRLLSTAGNLQISQVVNPLKTARMMLAKKILESLDIKYK